ncbi:MAG: hypothetical protein EOO88_44025 [Pedobacter sp.]|nr:MAG: hypothetical protein EOO88_44025 [Pedobacter sp.]
MQEQFPTAQSEETPEQTEARFNNATTTPAEIVTSSVEKSEKEHVSFWQKIRKGLFVGAAGAGILAAGGTATHEFVSNDAPETSVPDKDHSQDIMNNQQLPGFLNNEAPLSDVTGNLHNVPESLPDVYIPPTPPIDLTLQPKDPFFDNYNGPLQPEAYPTNSTELTPKDPSKDINANPELPDWVQMGDTQISIGGNNIPESYDSPLTPAPERSPLELKPVSSEVQSNSNN